MNKQKKERIIAEQTAKRTRFTKVFRTENHGGMAAIYSRPVHYEEGGSWKEIDNRLAPSPENAEVYENRASGMKVRFAKKADAKALVTIKRNGKQVSWNFAAAAAGLGKGAARSAVNTDGNMPEFVLMPEEADTEPETAGVIEPDTESETVGVIEPDTESEKNDAGNRQKEEAAGSAEAEDQSPEAKNQAIEAENQAKMRIPGLTSGGTYKEIAPGIDLSYTLIGETLKEYLILKTPEAAAVPLAFTISHKGLDLVPTADGGIDVKDEEGILFTFVPPCMYDGAGNVSNEVRYETRISAEESTLTVVPSMEWLQAPERSYPVLVDPTAETVKSTKNIEDTFVQEKSPDSAFPANNGSFTVGNNASYSRCRTLLKFRELPALENGAVIYNARIHVWQYRFSSNNGADFYITAHKVNGSWYSGTSTWNNQPSYDSTVLSYDKVGQVQSGSQIAITPRSFDVTRLVREWYNTGVNNGILLKAENEGMKQEAVFVSSDYPTPNSYGITSDQYPSGVFYYRSTSGLEDYYSYHEQALGRAGTGYVNDFNGNLVYVHEDTGTSGELLPIGIRHVYNLSDRSTDGRIGKGWRLNFIREMAGTGKSDFPYVYTDEDGTRHYFYKDTADGNKLKDEDGLGFTLTQASSSDFDSYYIMKDKDDYQYVFGQDHFMRSITDPNGNIQKAQYGPSSDGNYLAWITDPTGAQVKFGYLSSGKLSYVEANGRKVSYSYDSSGHLTRITYPDGKRTELLYSGDLLTRVQRPDGRAINYAYVNDCKVQRVSEIREALGPENGQILKISYRNGSTTVFEEQGLDGSISSTADNRKYTCHFDNYGSPADISDGDGFANSYRYYREGMKNNKLSHTGSLQRSVRNLLKNQSFVVNDSTWGKQIPAASGNSITRATSGGYLGDHSMKIVKADTSGDGVVTQQVSLAAGTYTLSAYVKTQSVTASSGGGAGLSVKYDSTTMKSRTMLTGTTDTEADKGWERLAVTFTLSAAKTVTVSAGLFAAKGTAYVTCCQLEKGSIANKYNLVYNAGFQSAFGSATGNWEVKGSGSGDGQVTDSVRGTCGGLKGSITGEKYLKQAVNVRGTEGDVFTLGCWVKASAVPGKNFRLRAAIIYDTGNPKWVDIDCNPYVEEWQYVSGVILTDDEDSATEKRTYNAIHLFLAYDNQANQAYFSDIQLVKDDGESFVYDAKGNVASAKTAAEESGFTYDQKENLTRLADVTGSAFEYGYDSKHNLLSVRNSEGVGYYYVLNAKGQPTILRARNDRMTTSITAGRTYLIRNRKSGKYLEVAYGTDADGTNVQQGDFNGSSAQKWKVVDSGGGYVRLVSATGSRVLTVHNSADVINTNIELMTDAKTDGQLLRISSKGYTCVLCPKCSGDKKVLDVHGASNEGGANVILANQNESRNSQQWYFEPAENVGTDTLAAGRTYAIRLRHSGQYMAVKDNSTSVGAPIIQAWYNGKNYEYFRINTAGGGQYSLEPVSAPGKALSLSDANVLTLANKDTTDPHQRFTFVKRDTVYSIVGASGAHLEAADASYTFTAAVRGTVVTGEPGTHQSFILEECSDRIEAFAAYTSTGRNIASVKNTRGYTTRYIYDSDDRLLTGVTDAKGNTVNYAYEANTDRLTKVSAAVGSQTVENTYSYDDADRLSAIGHNGFTYQFSYDSFDNLTKVTAGGNHPGGTDLPCFQRPPLGGALWKRERAEKHLRQTAARHRTEVGQRQCLPFYL